MPETSRIGYSGTIPRYKEPEIDWRRISGLQQEQMAPSISESRRGLRSIQAQSYANPMEMSEAYRAGTRGYGESLGDIQAGGMRTALSMYQPELESKRRQSLADYQTAMAEWEKKQQETGLQKQQAISDAAKNFYTDETFFDRTTGQYRFGTKPREVTKLPLYSQAPTIEQAKKTSTWDMSPTEAANAYWGASKPSPTIYGAGSEEAYRRAMGYTSGGGTARTY